MNCDRSPANADFGKGDLEVADFTDAPHARFIASLANHADDFVRLLRAAEETREQLLRDFAIKCRCDFVTKLSAGIERCVGCRARDRIAAIDSALAPFEEANRD